MATAARTSPRLTHHITVIVLSEIAALLWTCTKLSLPLGTATDTRVRRRLSLTDTAGTVAAESKVVVHFAS
jgi:hypothetical protein